MKNNYINNCNLNYIVHFNNIDSKVEVFERKEISKVLSKTFNLKEKNLIYLKNIRQVELSKKLGYSQSLKRWGKSCKFNFFPKHSSLGVIGFFDRKLQETRYIIVDIDKREIIIESNVFLGGSTVIAEFLGVVEAMKLNDTSRGKENIYCDIFAVRKWVRDRKCGTWIGEGGEGFLSDELREEIIEAETYLNIIDELPVIDNWHSNIWGKLVNWII